METFHAIFENGVFRPTVPVSFPDHCEVELRGRIVNGKTVDDDMDEIYEILDRRYTSGHTDTAARHNEHQP
jgi:predicted DNA-binding antitoxin AbrB/MazE fold protein